MLRVVLDANVFVSALLSPSSKPAEIIEMIQRGEILLVVSPQIIAEIESVLFYPRIRKRIPFRPVEIRDFVRHLESISFVTSGELEVDFIVADPDDNIYLACAYEGTADFIVSGDRHLLDVKSFQGIPIVNPALFLKWTGN